MLPIRRYNGKFFISELGNIYSNHRGKGVKFRKPHRDPSGYLRIKLASGGETIRIHREVLRAFDRDPTYITLKNNAIQLELCRHLDGDPLNNCLTNLKWGSPYENVQDALRHNAYLKHNKGNQKFSNKVVQEIREWHKEGASNKDIRLMYGVSKAHVSYIINKRTRKGV